MALRTQIRIGAFLIAGAIVSAQTFTYNVRHGVLRITDTSISLEDKKHSHEWKYSDIQQLSISPDRMRLLTYEDQRWKFGRDREYVFEHLPPQMAEKLYPFLLSKLGQRLIAELNEPLSKPLWQANVKLRRGRAGSQGTLLVGDEQIVYQTEVRGQSRTWRYKDIDNLSSASPFELNLMVLERSGWSRGTPTEFRFQLKDPLPENRYNDLWRRLNASKGLAIFAEK
jgi:hypothetical protein